MTSVGSSEDQTGNPPGGWDSEGQLRIVNFVIPAKFRKAVREPGSRNNLVELNQRAHSPQRLDLSASTSLAAGLASELYKID
jgi:hypothetical protein